MTLFECLQSFLTSNETLAAKVTGGILPQILPQERTLPCIVVRIISGKSMSATHDGGMSPWSSVRIECTVWGNSYKMNEQAALLIINQFNSFRGYLGGSTSGLFYAESYQGPRSVQDQTTRIVGVQVDILGLLNISTLS